MSPVDLRWNSRKMKGLKADALLTICICGKTVLYSFYAFVLTENQTWSIGEKLFPKITVIAPG